LSERIMIVDQLNMFFRAYIVDPSISSNGQPIGGLKGSLKILQKLCREVKPDKVFICWDGPGGSAKRKLIKKDYKDGRKPIRLNREIKNLSDGEELENKIWQQTRLVDYFNYLPICQFMFPGVEADDVIAYVTKLKKYKDCEKVIVSSDKDFFQLLDDKTVLFRPVQKEVMNKLGLIEKFDIHPNNFAIARAIAGDKSDNLGGVPGLGLKTVSKRFPFLREERSYNIKDILGYCKESAPESSVKAYDRVLEYNDVLNRNYKMMQLYSPMIDVDSKKVVRQTVEGASLDFNKTQIKKMMIEDGMGEYNWFELFSTMNRISSTK
jgi:5'-3' exonuclease